MDQQLRFAIAHKRLLQLHYSGRLRVVEPHDYGILNGTVKLLAYQVRAPGAGDRKPVRGWRLFDVPKIEACLVLEETFPGSRGDSSQRHMAWDEVFARVK